MAAPAGAPMDMPPLPPFEDRAPNIMALMWTEGSIAMIVVGLRLFARFQARALAIDDYLMAFALVMFIAICCLQTYIASIQGFQHFAYLTPEHQYMFGLLGFPGETVVILSLIPSKLSVAALILRIMGPTAGMLRRVILWGVMVTVVVFNVINVILLFAQCTPWQAAWNPMVQGKCWEPSVVLNYSIFASTWSILLDVILALLPMSFLWSLQIPLRRRIELSILMSLGLLAGICGILKITTLVETTAHSEAADPSWNTFPVQCWATSETFIVIVAGSIPPLRTLWDKYVPLISRFTSRRTTEQQNLKPSKASYQMMSKGTRPTKSDTESQTGIRQTIDIDITSMHDSK